MNFGKGMWEICCDSVHNLGLLNYMALSSYVILYFTVLGQNVFTFYKESFSSFKVDHLHSILKFYKLANIPLATFYSLVLN